MQSITERISCKQVIAVIFTGISAKIIDDEHPSTTKWVSHYNDDHYIWTLEEDRQQPMLICQVPLRYSIGHAPKPNLADVIVSNSAIFSAFPASITQNMLTDELLLSWQCALFNGLQANELIRIMGSMSEIKKALLIRWALKAELAKPIRQDEALH